MAGITVSLLGAVLMVLTIGLLPRNAAPGLVAVGLGLMALLPWGMLASQFAANYLVSVRPRK